jgi:hypothetical protein
MKVAKQSSTWDFNVHQENLPSRAGVLTGIHAVIRSDTGECVGQYKGKKLVPNKQVVEVFENEMNKRGIPFSPAYLVTAGGARFFATYRIAGLQIKGVLGEVFNGMFRLQNSYDGSLKIGFETMLERLACLNGMKTLQELFAMLKRHSEELDLSYVAAQIEVAVNSLPNLEKEFAMLADVNLSHEQGISVLANLTKLNKYPLSEKMATRIAGNWEVPSDDEKPLGNTLYRLFNAGTRVFRDLEGSRFELANRTNGMFTEQLLLAARNRNSLNQLLVPATLDKE